MKENQCPRCGHMIPSDAEPGAYPGALSRSESGVEICSDCGTDEAMRDFTGRTHLDRSAWFDRTRSAKVGTLRFGGVTWYGVSLRRAQYEDGSLAVVLEQGGERLTAASVRLVDHPRPGEHQFYIPNWSETEGLALSLQQAGVVALKDWVLVGPFDSPAILAELTPEFC